MVGCGQATFRPLSMVCPRCCMWARFLFGTGSMPSAGTGFHVLLVSRSVRWGLLHARLIRPEAMPARAGGDTVAGHRPSTRPGSQRPAASEFSVTQSETASKLYPSPARTPPALALPCPCCPARRARSPAATPCYSSQTSRLPNPRRCISRSPDRSPAASAPVSLPTGTANR